MEINKLKTKLKSLNKKQVVLGLSIIVCSVFLFKKFTASSEIDSSALEALMNESQPTAPGPLKNELVHEQVSATKNTEREATEEEIEFIVSRDFNAGLACTQMLANSLNPELQQKWLQLRLAKNAQRERTRRAKLKLEEDQATFQSTKLEKQTKALGLAKVTQDNFGSFLSGDHSNALGNEAEEKIWPEIKVISITKDQKATFTIQGERFVKRKMNETARGLTLSDVNYVEGCVSFVDGSIKRVCI